MMFGLFDWLKFGAGMACGAVLMTAYVYAIVEPRAREEGRQAERQASLERSMELIRERSATNERVGRMSDSELCISLGGSWLPDERQCQ